MRPLTADEGRELIAIARAALDLQLREGRPFSGKPTHPRLLEPGAAFVSLHQEGTLRGCIGCLKPTRPLYQTVAECAVSAALHDHRFSPVTLDELADLHIEVSVLGPLQPVSRPDEIKIGKHGLFIRKGGYQGVLLPQVARDLKLDGIRFLDATCRKAGLPPGAWREGASIEAFTAEIFESEPE